ncbi:MAG: tetraacyldisaccharide 4'-kinase, partial [Kiritimatiellae bacterium]|nr:tetraacyldisaccharide 4'-kinase [Kiritimatiellia bacterium]
QHAIRALGCDTLILDDGFQYLKLKHRLDVLLVDRTNPFGFGRMLPRGLLREPVRNLRRAGYIFITKSGEGDNTELRNRLRSLNPTAEISECRHCPRHLQDVFTRERFPLSTLQDLPVAAVTGIASPEGFYRELENRGARVVYRKRFADHHRYSQQELLNVINEGMAAGARAVLTTEKDYVRFPLIERADLPVYFLRVEIEMTSGADAFHEWIDRICFR